MGIAICLSTLAIVGRGFPAGAATGNGAAHGHLKPKIGVTVLAPRPQSDIDRDADRHPKELLEFAKVKTGDTVIDLMPGYGYFTRLFSQAVGPNGHVVADVPDELKEKKFKPVDAAEVLTKELKNVQMNVSPVTKQPMTNVDLFWTSQNYHDLHTSSFPNLDVAAVNRAVFQALKPGGFYVIIDHSAKAGTPLEQTDKLHRIDPAIVKREVEAAGFKLDGESPVLANSGDPKTANVFDDSIRGHTDQFALRFVKPLSPWPK